MMRARRVITARLHACAAQLTAMPACQAALNAELEASARKAASRQKKFTAYTLEQKRAIMEAAPSKAEVSAAAGSADSDAEEAVPEATPAPPTPPKPKASPKASKGGACKPKWAMTEGEADGAEDDEAADLVDFAASLDYDAYIDDLEATPRPWARPLVAHR